MKALPRSVAVVGGAATGCQLASVFAAFGSRVWLLNVAPRILGAHIVGEQAVEIVQIAATAMRAGMPVAQLAEVEFAYPTFTAVVGLAARSILRELGLVAVSLRWGIPERTLGTEWEHRDE